MMEEFEIGETVEDAETGEYATILARVEGGWMIRLLDSGREVFRSDDELAIGWE
jgi:hypothetical protein